MAIIFELFVECESEAETNAISEHFKDFAYDSITGKRIVFQEYRATLTPQGLALAIHSPNLSQRAVRSVADAVEYTEAGLHLMHHLRSAPRFLFARADIEAGIICSQELTDFFEKDASGDLHTRLEFVVAESFYARLGKPKHFVPFRPGYLWSPFRGVAYKPLFANDQQPLNNLCCRLFPPNIDAQVDIRAE